MKVPLLDLKAQYHSIKTEIDSAVAEIFNSQMFINGDKVTECEKAVAAYSDCQFAVGVSSGTDALIISLMAENINQGSEVITTPYSFFATVGSIVRLGARPVFVDIDPDTYNIDSSAIEKKITGKTKAIIPIHLFGQLADMEPIVSLAKIHDLTIIEDAAQAIGSENNGKRAGTFGRYGCFSFFPSKNLGAAGDAGMVVTNDRDKADILDSLRNHGSQHKYSHDLVGGNFRLDALQAAIITVKISYLDSWTMARQVNAQHYNRLFNESGLTNQECIQTPVDITTRHIYNQYTIRANKRDQLCEFLRKKEIGNEVYYPVPLHLQECFSFLGYRQGDFPHSEKAAGETLALPVYPELTIAQQEYIVSAIAEFYRNL